MLTHFPSALPDELLYSRLARWHLHNGSGSAKRTLDDLFADRTVRAGIDLQCHLGALSKRISALCPCTLPELLNQTLFGYYTSYQTAKLANAVRHSMIDGPAAGLHARLGIAAGMRLPPYPLRWCRDCNADAANRYGELYWRRVHQLPAVMLCPDHGTPLQNARLPEVINQHEFIAATFRNCHATTPDLTYPTETAAFLVALARQSARLLDKPHVFADMAAPSHHCKDRLMAADLTLPSGRLCIARLIDLTERRLRPLRGIFPEATSTNWIIDMGRKHRRAFSPLQYLLLELILDGTSTLPARKRTLSPEPRQFLADDQDFETRLRQAALQGRSLREVARIVGVDPITIKRHAERLKIDGPWVLSLAPTAKAITDPSAGIKQRWLANVQTGGTRNALRRKAPAEWVWLKRHDPNWLEQHSPSKLTRAGAGRPRTDWNNLDIQLAAEIHHAINQIIAEIPPCRISKSEVERRIDRHGWFAPRLDKLDLPGFGGERLAQFPGLSLEGDGALKAER